MIIQIKINKINNKNIYENTKIENLWTITPIVIIIIISTISIKLLYINYEKKLNIINIKVIRNQWFWSYEYINFNIKFNSYINLKKNFHIDLIETDNKLILPFKYQIQIIFTSIDVIHSWTIPPINIKIDCIPNQINQITIKINIPSILFGQCSEICGINHRIIPISIESINLNNIIKWIKNFLLEILNRIDLLSQK
jgi:heme/copper-type cytochrome/quinol oxidase subunit 2